MFSHTQYDMSEMFRGHYIEKWFVFLEVCLKIISKQEHRKDV